MKLFGKFAASAGRGRLVASCSASPRRPTGIEAIDFSQFKTYAWKDVEPMQNQLTEERIMAAVDRTLGLQGLRKVDSNPDLWVVMHTRLTKETQINTYDSGWGYGGWGGYGWGAWGSMGMTSSTSTVSEIPVGQSRHRPGRRRRRSRWSGAALPAKRSTRAPRRRRGRRTSDEAVAKMFAELPAGRGQVTDPDSPGSGPGPRRPSAAAWLPGEVPGSPPVSRRYPSRYFSRVVRTTPSGSRGAGGRLFQPVDSSQSRTNCLS